jgi:hypothetical protein
LDAIGLRQAARELTYGVVELAGGFSASTRGYYEVIV